jgi:phosphonate transport system substrate-binding protein
MITRIITLFITTIFLTACSPSRNPLVDLNQLYPLSTPSEQEIIPLRLAVAAVLSPKGTFESYESLQDYLSMRLQRPVELVQRANYLETNQLLESGEVEVAFVCTGAYILGERDFGMEILVVPEVNGEAAYHSWLLVPANSPASSMKDLRGKTFAFTDPLSHTGRIYPTYLVQQLGEQPEEFFGKIFYTYSHDAAILAVAEGLADGAAIDNLIYLYLLDRDPEVESRVRIIHKSEPFGMPPVVVSAHIRPQLKAELRDLFLTMHEDEEGRNVLYTLGIDRFVNIGKEAYDSVRALEASVNQPEISQP